MKLGGVQAGDLKCRVYYLIRTGRFLEQAPNFPNSGKSKELQGPRSLLLSFSTGQRL